MRESDLIQKGHERQESLIAAARDVLEILSAENSNAILIEAERELRMADKELRRIRLATTLAEFDDIIVIAGTLLKFTNGSAGACMNAAIEAVIGSTTKNGLEILKRKAAEVRKAKKK